MTRDEIIAGLHEGRTLNIVRRDAPEARIALDLINEGIAEGRVVQLNEQSSVMKITIAQSAEENSSV